MARNYLSIPGMLVIIIFELYFIPTNVKPTFFLATSVDVECMFSKGRLLLSHVHNRLSVYSTRALLCVGNWRKLGYVNKNDVRDAAHLPDLKEGDFDPEEELDMAL